MSVRSILSLAPTASAPAPSCLTGDRSPLACSGPGTPGRWLRPAGSTPLLAPIVAAAARRRLRGCLKRGDSRGIEAVHLEYENEPTVSNRFNRPSVGWYQRPNPPRKARRSTAQLADASRHQCDLVSCSEWMPMAHATAGVSSMAECLHLLSAMAR